MTTLPPDSYTARRLEHATPEHLHLTSRRAFIGPIPDGWLKSHRKQWYRRYIIPGANRAPTFTAAHPIASESRQPLAGTTHTNTGLTVVDSPDVESLPRPSSQSAAQASTKATSTTSLLHGQPERSSVALSSVRPSVQQEEAEQAEPSVRSELRGILQSGGRRLDRVASRIQTQTQKVHFSDATKQQLRSRAQRLAAKGNFRSSKIKDGEVLKMDRMLVRIDITQQSIGQDFDERIAQGVETKSMDKWREFMVVCRKHTDGDADSVLQLYKTRVIAATAADVGKAKKSAKANIALSSSRTKVSLYSSLDKTLCVWTVGDSRTTIYYLRPQSGATSVEWYAFLRTALGWKRAQTLQVNVPDLGVTLRLDEPFKEIQASELWAKAADGDDDALAKVVNDEKGAAGAIVARCIEMLSKSPEWSGVLKVWAQYDRIGLAWKRYDRLEWVHGAVEQRMYGTIAMQKTHDLELRPKEHYPVKTKSRKGKDLEEPPPTEGFLIRLTSQKGQERRLGKMMFKRLYFTTQDQYLVFLRPAKSLPPPPPKLAVKSNGNVPSAKELNDQAPLTFAVEPYPLESKNIAWLDSDDVKSTSEQKAHDQDAVAEAERNRKMLLACDGFIDICAIQQVRKMRIGASPADANMTDGSDVDFDVGHERDQAADGSSDGQHQDDGATTEVDADRTFELVMSNGLIIRLQAYNKLTLKEWMTSLRALAKYWRHRARADMDLFKSTRQQNLETLRIDERAEAIVGSFAYKWEVGQSYASPLMYNMCGIAQCRTVHLSGILYRKPRRHTTFIRCRVILSQGHLLIFQDTMRKRSGQKQLHVHHERIASICLSGCYLYSGLLTENDLLYQNQTFDSNQPGHHALPKIYLEDQWTSTDEDAMTTFTIWHAKSKSWFRSSQNVDDVKEQEDVDERAERRRGDLKKTKLTRVSQLGVTGRSVVFKARSRAERDQWVMGIQVEIERLAQREAESGRGAEEVRLVGSGDKG